MANDYYDNTTNIILPSTSAEAADVENKCDDIAAGFELVEDDMDNTVQLTNADNTNRVIADAAGVRANKMLGFDSAGEFGNQVRKGTYKGDWAGTTYYYQDDLVRDTTDALSEGVGSLFVCNVTHTSSAGMVTDTANWDVAISTDDYLSTLGGTVTGQIKGITPVADEDLARKGYVDAADDLKASLAGSNTFTANNIFEGAYHYIDTTYAWIRSTNPDLTLQADSTSGNSLISMDDGTVSRAGMGYYGVGEYAFIFLNDSGGSRLTTFTIGTDGVTSNGKVNGATVHATNGATGTATSANTLTIVDGIITNIA